MSADREHARFMRQPLKTDVERHGQAYVDEPILVHPKITPLGAEVMKAFGRAPPKPVTIGHDRVRLRWMKPDGKGGLVPE